MNAKRLIPAVVFVFICFAFDSGSAQTKDILKLKMGHSQAATHYYHKAGLSLASKVAKYSNGKISIDIYPACQLGGERDMIEGLRLGTVQVYLGAMATLTQFVPEFTAFQLPYLLRDYEHGIKVWDQVMAQRLSGKMDKAGLHLLGFVKSSPRGVQTSKPIMKLADLKGLRIRTMEARIYVEAYKALGVIPTPIPYPELTSALQTGVVDGADQGFTAYLSTKAYQVSPFWAHIDIVQTLSPFLLAESVWKKLPKDLKEAVDKAALETLREQIPVYEEEVKKYEKTALESKFPFAYTFPDLTEFREAVKPVYAKFENEVSKDLVQKILSVK